MRGSERPEYEKYGAFSLFFSENEANIVLLTLFYEVPTVAECGGICFGLGLESVLQFE